MTSNMIHRGPDTGDWISDRFHSGWVSLGHRRLSIIELSPLGHQPMTSTDTSATLVYNGEIYNHQSLRRKLEREGDVFRGNSDTEVLLAGMMRYGIRFIEQLEGMYAFAYLDRNAQTLTLVRDPAGIKPLYFHSAPQQFLFASEVQPILATGMVRQAISREAVASFLAYGSVAQPLTIMQDIRMLAPGSPMVLNIVSGEIRSQQDAPWWRMPEPSYGGTIEQAVAITEQLLSNAVRDHLIADVPVGVFLSAGIDSTVIASYAHLHNPNVRAFTIALSEDKEMDEMSIAAETAKRIGIEHVRVTIGQNDAEQAAFEWLAHADQPSIDGLNTFVISKAVRDQGIKVAISGLGADELFGGYPSFTEVPKIASFARWYRLCPKPLRNLAMRMLGTVKPPESVSKLRDMLELTPTIASLAVQRRRLMNEHQMWQLGYESKNRSCANLWLPIEAMKILEESSPATGWTISRMESTFYQGNTLLRDSDANSMASSLELRVPFLDQRLLNWIPSLPDSIRFPVGGPSKFLLREAGKEHLDKIHLRRPKSGFTLPIHRWMAGPMKGLCEARIESLKDSGLVKPDGVNAIWTSFLQEPTLQAASRSLALVALGACLTSADSR